MNGIPEQAQEKLPEVPKQRTDVQIIISTCVQFVLIFIVLLMFDTLIDLLSGLLDLLVELLHIALEVIETVVEQALEHALDTTHQQSETIILNAFVVLMFLSGYWFFKSLPSLWGRLSRLIDRVWHGFIKQVSSQWKSCSLLLKLKLIVLYILGFSGVFFLIG